MASVCTASNDAVRERGTKIGATTSIIPGQAPYGSGAGNAECNGTSASHRYSRTWSLPQAGKMNLCSSESLDGSRAMGASPPPERHAIGARSNANHKPNRP
jgi:hypothetical protein